MSRLTMLLFLCAFSSAAYSQPGKKPKPKEKPPTQSEMQKLMQEAQMEMDNLDPETLRLMDSMGIKRPNFKNVPKFSNQQLANAYAEEGKVVPTKKSALIAAIPKKIFTISELAAYVKTTDLSIATIITADAKQIADKVIQQFANDPYAGAMMASAANGLWLNGYKEAATYLMGKATELLPNANNYNNYAAYLTMMGAAHMAIPVLEKINSIHKRNSTVYNNLGQAWLALGEEEKANKYLDSAVMIYAYHPQANFTKCLLFEAKGQIAESIEALLRSMKHSVTKTKTNKLKQLQKDKYKRPKYYLPKVYYSESFNLGLYTALIPKSYSFSAGITIENAWEQFRAQVREEITRLENEVARHSQKMESELIHIQQKTLQQRGLVFPPYYYKAVDNYNSFLESTNRERTKRAEKNIAYITRLAEIQKLFQEELSKEKEKFNQRVENGENLQDDCVGETPIINKYLTAANSLNQAYNEEWIRELVSFTYQMKDHVTATALSDASAVVAVLQTKIGFLTHILELNHDHYLGFDCSAGEPEPNKKKKGKMPDFDEVNCKTLNTITSPGIGTIVMRCNNMTMNLNPILLPFKGSLTANFDGYIEQASVGVTVKAVEIEMGAVFDKDGNFVEGNGSVSTTVKGIEVKANGEINADGFVKGSLELGIDGALKFLPTTLDGEAPVEISLKNELGLTIELSEDGIGDVYVKDKITGTVAANIETDSNVEITPGMISETGEVTAPETVQLPTPKTPSVSVSADNRWSVNSGYSTSGSLSGLRSK